MGTYAVLTARIYFPPLCSCTACCAHHVLILGWDYNCLFKAQLHRALGQRESLNHPARLSTEHGALLFTHLPLHRTQ